MPTRRSAWKMKIRKMISAFVKVDCQCLGRVSEEVASKDGSG